MKIVLVGHVCVDSNVSEQSSYTGWGSALMYMAAYFHTHTNIEPFLVAPYGKDFKRYTEGIHFLSVPKGEHTLLYRNRTYHDHRVQQCSYVDFATPVPLTREINSRIAEADIIVLAPLLPNCAIEYVRALLLARKPESLAVLLPQGYLRAVNPGGDILPRDFKEADDILPLFDMVIFSESDLPDALAQAQKWAQHNAAANIIMTQGESGASWVTAESVVSVKTTPVPEDQIIDSVGCGDTFSAATMYKYFVDRDLVAAIGAGNKAARAKLRQARPRLVRDS